MEDAIVDKKKNISKLIKMLVICVCIILFLCISLSIEYFNTDRMDYVVNSDQKTCTITGAKKNNILFLRIPEKIDEYVVTEIAPQAFKDHKLFGVVFPSTITKIGKQAFADCKYLLWVKNINNCKSLKIIESEAFLGCVNLKKLELSSEITTIGERAFFECASWRNPSIPSGLETIDHAVFALCQSFKEIFIPANVRHISPTAFTACTSLEKITVDETNQYWCVFEGALFSKDMKNLLFHAPGINEDTFTIPSGVEVISDRAFYCNDSLRTLNIPNSIKEIGDLILLMVDFKNSQFDTINYDGTIDMWKSIKKSSDWDLSSPNFTIYCTDGQIAKDGTVTYN